VRGEAVIWEDGRRSTTVGDQVHGCPHNDDTVCPRHHR
jgi:hypothetical protein